VAETLFHVGESFNYKPEQGPY